MDYEYELREHDGAIVATGHLSRDEQLAVGDRITIGQRHGTVTGVMPPVAGRAARVTIEVGYP